MTDQVIAPPAAAEAKPAPAPEAAPVPEAAAVSEAAAVPAPVPQVPEVPQTPEAVPPAPQSLQALQAPRPPRRVLRAVARWAAAVVVFAGLGSGVAFGISGMERGDVPGLATQDDGRWTYPRLSLPALPAGSPRPFTDANEAEIHHADLRALLLPAPAGATVDKKLPGGWTGVDRYLAEYAPVERAALKAALRDYVVRHVAARGWTMPDGTSTRVYLLQFQSTAYAVEFQYSDIGNVLTAGTPLAAAPTTELDEGWAEEDLVQDTTARAYVEPKPYGDSQVRQAYVLAGDTVALIVQEKKGGAAAVPFHQTLILQSQLLG
ncbi:hypothetical protein KQY30_19670 [Streptomyces sp. GMY02]|uniref:hypothetical protein n=1 Tax=Streptomyces sp. GMY02 TaxID=1333528 RepID=UPI001C2C8E96|nr:hypothetical protein [Streptomyces sp. GMY02]QXE36126.1 hypothetical protein KQY30_19670 [Streptomyces sp. GMY02]